MFWAFDTEDDSNGHVHWINFYDGKRHVPFKSMQEAIPWILEQEGDFWACNLEYDLINLFGPFLDQLCVLTYGGFGLLKAHVHGRPVKFYNTVRHWAMSVEEMGERLGYPKLPFEPTNLKYCQRDCEVTWKFIYEMFKRYHELGMEKIGSTLPSTALKFFLAKYCKAEYRKHPDHELWEFLAESRYGGRCEVFQTRPVTGKIYEYDINSSYPAAMQKEAFPDLDTLRVNPSRLRLEKEGVARVVVTAPHMQFPILPHKHKELNKLIFPIGTFDGTWTYPELRLAIEYGYTIDKLLFCAEYDAMESPFSEYINYLYTERMKVKDSDPLLAYTMKIAMNSTFGKFSEKGGITIVSKGKKHTMGGVPKHSNMVWSTYILAYGRINLYRYMMQAAEKGELLYVDTDSVFIRANEKPFEGSKDLGSLGFKGEYTYAHFKLPKLYRVDDSYKAKGVPLDKRHKDDMQHLKREFFYDGIAEFMKPFRFMEARKLKEMPNVWRSVSKQCHATYDKRVAMKDGRTWPIQVGV